MLLRSTWGTSGWAACRPRSSVSGGHCRCLVPVTRWLAHLCGLLPNGPGMEASLSLILEKARVYTVGLVLFDIVFVSLRIE